jgi:hypothetical protein
MPAQPDTPPSAPTPAVAPAAAKPAAQPEKASVVATMEMSPASTSTVKETPVKPAAMAATASVESAMASSDSAASKPVAPFKTANTAAANTVAAETIPRAIAAPGDGAGQNTAETPLPKIQRTEFGVDLGTANSIAGLRALWRGLLKSQANAPLAALQPIIVIREAAGDRAMQFRLVAGPLRDAAAAAKICAVMSENQRACETAVYDGQRLPLKTDDPSATKSVASTAPRKGSAPQKRTAAEEPTSQPEAQAQAPSGWSSFFGRKN